ncbi:glycosyltransferase [Mucilaginibacter aquariorum]|uniref:Glycosyltransferase family 2 protein n=1 Tax=Mucilaginibacter aquariorum TaxID=2967225 RepID=A0ABT1SWE0_9SPHI|nr:glycosyltransferase [Mucilaginibacter aquariorum]MCQ6956533.1 glycosyltransferase family 2 protein [Mucilaginibacter aquariorum]
MIISVVVPTYRRPQLLTKCLEALLMQKFDKSQYEVIVVSDGPDAETKKIFDDLTGHDYPSLRFIAMPQKKGPAAARNYGWLNAKGHIIAFTDDDCVPDAYWLKEIVAHCDSNENVALTGKVIVPVSKRPTDYELNTANLQKSDFITANCACTKKALLKAGGFDEQFSMAWREDSDLEFKLINNNIPIKRTESALVTHPVRKSTWGVSVKEQKKTMFDALLYKKYPQLYRQKINPRSPVLYYLIITGFLLMLSGLITGLPILTLTGSIVWISFTLFFITKRLYTTKLTINHIAEMVVTSIIIPFVSVFWQWYGAVKYRVLFI